MKPAVLPRSSLESVRDPGARVSAFRWRVVGWGLLSTVVYLFAAILLITTLNLTLDMHWNQGDPALPLIHVPQYGHSFLFSWLFVMFLVMLGYGLLCNRIGRREAAPLIVLMVMSMAWALVLEDRADRRLLLVQPSRMDQLVAEGRYHELRLLLGDPGFDPLGRHYVLSQLALHAGSAGLLQQEGRLLFDGLQRQTLMGQSALWHDRLSYRQEVIDAVATALPSSASAHDFHAFRPWEGSNAGHTLLVLRWPVAILLMGAAAVMLRVWVRLQARLAHIRALPGAGRPR